MKKVIKLFVDFIGRKKSIVYEDQIDRGVKYSLKKYKETYKLLERYDSSTEKDPTLLADPGRLRSYIQ